MTIEQMIERKKELGFSYEKISDLANLPLSTVQKVLGGYTKSPRYKTLKKLEYVLGYDGMFAPDEPVYPVLKEASTHGCEIKKQGDYTLEDYYALPDDERVELIDGAIYVMEAPGVPHQHFCLELAIYLKEYIKKNKGKCMPFVSPIDVQLDCDQKTMVQPDVLVLCDLGKIKRKCIYGVPDFIIEVLSPGTKKKDTMLKLWKYANAGVREFWYVDLERKRVFVHELEKDDVDLIQIYTFEDEVPVGIFDGQCKIRFGDIYESVAFLFEQEEEEE